MKKSFLKALVFCLWLAAPAGELWAMDPPHNFSCDKCHSAHSALGMSLTTAASNANLCQSCHVTGGDASGLPFINTMQASGSAGTSHSWGGPLINAAYSAEIPQSAALVLRLEGTLKGMATQNSINNTSVTYSYANYTSGGLVGQYILFYSTQAATGANKGLQRGITANDSTTITWSPGLPSNPVKYDRYVVAGSNARISCSTCHSQHSQYMSAWDPLSSQTYTREVTNNRHMMRFNNNLNQLCEDCHRSRVMSYTQVKDESLADGTRRFSHPVGDILNSQGYDNAAPLDANGAPQSNSTGGALRYAGDADGNPDNNIVLDAGGKVRCLSCHRLHYSDSNSLTNSTDLK